MFKKKFKVKVVHFNGDKYKICYAYFRFIPIYYEITWWFSQSYTSNTECWTTKLESVKYAEIFAKSLKSIEDINNWYNPQKEKEKQFYKEKKEYHKKNVPYKNKTIK